MSPKRTGCDGRTEVYSRVTGFYRPVQSWNTGKMAEFAARKSYRPCDVELEDEPDEAPAGVAQVG